ncbi:urea transporter [Niabella drilacis]|uniref:Urea transporter n=1 Tax=Niabella drilacis (strain DSM 25811 / CCM 8410 / CCUG 62505 / LMG 26954 / E90) TaxID=1285928 RepID=A0A1G6UZR8_NIADE|nr:urea transporter [Niabella drilacis]SDD46135.1 urea transporter [Niabella drilacis]
MQSKSFIFARTVFRSIGQIMLQENALTGLLFLVGIFYGSVPGGIAALLSAVTGVLTAQLLQYDRQEIEQGLYGFSATLVGVAMVFYFQPVPVIWIAVIIGSALATILQHVFIVKKLPGFTFPFIIVTWILLYVFHHLIIEPNSVAVVNEMIEKDDFATSIHGFGEVIFQDSIIGGLLFFLGVFINKPIAALYGITGAILSAYIAIHLSEPALDIEMGLFSFNALLCAITFAGDEPVDGIFVLFSVVLTVIIDIAMLRMQWSVLTFPFVAASWVTLTLKRWIPLPPKGIAPDK